MTSLQRVISGEYFRLHEGAVSMKGVVLAGGTGSRLFPLTKVTNKHLLPVGNQPMIFYPVNKLIQAGITDILIVTGLEHMGDVVQLLGSGKDFGCKFTYRVQDEAGGIAQALLLAEQFAGNDSITVILGDNIDSLKDAVSTFNGGAKLLLKEVHDPERLGVATLAGDTITNITEKRKTTGQQLLLQAFTCTILRYLILFALANHRHVVSWKFLM